MLDASKNTILFNLMPPRLMESRIIENGDKIQMAMGMRSMSDIGVSVGNISDARWLWTKHKSECSLSPDTATMGSLPVL